MPRTPSSLIFSKIRRHFRQRLLQRNARLPANGGFEFDGGWAINPTPYPAAYSTVLVHGGLRAMQTGIPLTAGDVYAYSSVSQTLMLPAVGAGQNLVLSLWRYSMSQDSNDQFYVSLWGAGDVMPRASAPSNQWERLSADVTAYAGQRITLVLGTYNDGDGLKSVAYYDDVAIAVQGP